MDIALRKDLIDIQELIANPPAPQPRKRRHLFAEQPPPEAAGSGRGQRALCWQLYGANREQLAASQPLLPSAGSRGQHLLQGRRLAGAGQRRHKSRHCRHRHGHHRGHGHLSSDDELEQLLAGRRLWSPERAVDVPEEDLSRRLAELGLADVAGSRTGASEQALFSDRKLSEGPFRLGPARGGRRQRTKTLVGGLDSDHLQPAAEQRWRPSSAGSVARPWPSSAAAAVVAATGGRRPGPPDEAELQQVACGPDERDEPAKWAAMMSKSAQNRPELEATAVIVSREPQVGRPTTGAPSPTGSLRSSIVSKSRGRLVLRPQRKSQLGAGLVRRPQLAVGRLSLLQMRNLVQRRAATERRPATAEAERPAAATGVVVAVETQPAEEGPRQQVGGAAPTGGRRQERLERLERQVSVAPNGNKLRLARPMAPLDDETQLYAIPKKSSKVSSQCPVGWEATGGRLARGAQEALVVQLRGSG